MKHARPTSAIAQFAAPGERSVNGAATSAASGGQMRLCPCERSVPGGGNGFSQRSSRSASGYSSFWKSTESDPSELATANIATAVTTGSTPRRAIVPTRWKAVCIF